MLIDLDANVLTCPTCGGALGASHRGRVTGKFLRHCRTPGCLTTAVSVEPPPDAAARLAPWRPRLNVPWALPFEGDHDDA